jgi:hypothetical protein
VRARRFFAIRRMKRSELNPGVWLYDADRRMLIFDRKKDAETWCKGRGINSRGLPCDGVYYGIQPVWAEMIPYKGYPEVSDHSPRQPEPA